MKICISKVVVGHRLTDMNNEALSCLERCSTDSEVAYELRLCTRALELGGNV